MCFFRLDLKNFPVSYLLFSRIILLYNILSGLWILFFNFIYTSLQPYYSSVAFVCSIEKFPLFLCDFNWWSLNW